MDQKIEEAVKEFESCLDKYKKTEEKLLQKPTDTEMDRLLDQFEKQQKGLHPARMTLKDAYQKRIDVSPDDKR